MKGEDQGELLVAGHHHLPKAIAALKSGAACFFEMPFTTDQMVARVRTLLEGDDHWRDTTPKWAEISARSLTLTRTERQIMELVVEGCTAGVVAGRLGMTVSAVDTLRNQAMLKMKAEDFSDLVRLASHLAEGVPNS